MLYNIFSEVLLTRPGKLAFFPPTPREEPKNMKEASFSHCHLFSGCGPAFCPAPSPHDPELSHLKVTAAKDAFDLHIPSLSSPVCKYEVPAVKEL